MILTAWRCGFGIGAFVKKYWTSDPYMFLTYFGVLMFFSLSSFKFSVEGEKRLAELFAYELAGLLGVGSGDRKQHLPKCR